MKELTAVKWLVEKLNQCEPMYSGIMSNEHKKYLDKLIEESLKIERKQHGKTWDAALDNYEVRAGNYMRAYEDFDDYYEQFKQD